MDKGIFVIGLGGTGGLLVPKLARILNGSKDVTVWLMDGDIVDKGNIERQPYQEFNKNEKKASALSGKVASNFDVRMHEYCEYITGEEICKISFYGCYEEVFILGCVDNHSTRILMEDQHRKIENSIYIDSANAFDDGSIFITKNENGEIIGKLRSEIFPEIKDINDHPSNHCATEIAKGNTQQFITNDIMANSIAKVVIEFMSGIGKTGVIKIEGFERIFVSDRPCTD